MDIAEKEAYGVTQKSTEFVRDNLKNIGAIVEIECLLAGNTHHEFADLKNDRYEQWVAFVDERKNRIVVSGFGWGYTGAGSDGLVKMAQELGFDLDMETVVSYPTSEYWNIHRERLQLTEELASYIISLQSIADMERGLGDDELKIRDQLELEFPVLRQRREQEEFNQWMWATRVEQEPEVVEARTLLGHDIPFDEIYHADDPKDPEAPESTYNLYRQHTEVAGDIFRETKATTDTKLHELDASGEIDLKKEWRNSREV